MHDPLTLRRRRTYCASCCDFTVPKWRENGGKHKMALDHLSEECSQIGSANEILPFSTLMYGARPHIRPDLTDINSESL
jgi:hypothetical protein